MTTVGSYEAKTHLPALLERVEKGERFIITRRGKPIATLQQHVEGQSFNIQETFRKMNELQKGNRLRRKKGQTLRELAHEGHRY